MVLSDVYALIKEALNFAKKVKNQQMIEKLMDIQEAFFEVREENQNLKEQIKDLKLQIENLEKCSEIEDDLIFSENGFCVKKNVSKRIPYCSHCWAEKHRLIPLSQQTSGGWWKYTCATCRIDITVQDAAGRGINEDITGEI